MTLELKNISISFSQKKVLEGVSIFFRDSCIHAVLGENGAGKSTTANIISGELQPDSGTILIDGEPVILSSAKDAIKHKICYVHQRPLICDDISLKENILLGLDKTQAKEIEPLAKKWLSTISLNTKARFAGSDTRFFTSLCGALLKNPEILILDEPTALLDQKQSDFLFKNLKELKDGGMNIIIITHNFDEAKAHCDTVCTLVDGRVMEKLPEIKTLSEIKQEPPKASKSGIFYKGLSRHPKNEPSVTDASFFVQKGEITLITGLAEDGLITLENLITGMRTRRSSGKITLKISEENFEKTINLEKDSFTTRILRYKMGIRAGIIPTNRKYRASNPQLSVRQVAESRDETISAEEIISEAKINIKPDEKAKNLSGGMLQRLIFSRELKSKPELLILCQPMQGLDSSACFETAKKIKAAAKNGAMIIVLSSREFPSQIATRRYTLKNGRLLAE